MHSEEGRILVTVDDYLPIIEISDSHPSSIGTDFSWLTKVSVSAVRKYGTIFVFKQKPVLAKLSGFIESCGCIVYGFD